MPSQLLSRHIAISAYVIAFLFVFVPLLDSFVAVLPFMPLEVSWRYRAENQLSQALLRPLFGVLLAYTVALLLEHRRVIKAISMASAFLVVFMALGIPLFIVDALDMRAGLRTEAQPLFEVSILVALLKFVLAAIALFTFTLPAWHAARSLKNLALSRIPNTSDAELIVRPH